MASLATQICLRTCETGLLLPAALVWGGSWLKENELAPLATALHRRQPTMAAFEQYAIDAADVIGGIHRKTVARTLMAVADLCGARRQFIIAECAAVTACIALHERFDAVPEDATYPRVIPPALTDVDVPGVAEPGEVLLRRVLAVQPFCGFLEQQRAQCRRTLAEMALYDVPAILAGFGASLERQLVDVTSGGHAAMRRARKATRRSIRRAIRLYDQCIGGDGLRQFLGARAPGDAPAQMLVAGARYDYLLQRTDSVLDFTANTSSETVPYGLAIHNKAGEYLADACVYFDGLPVIDQIVALTLHARLPALEQDLLANTHMSCCTQAFFRDPLLPGLTGLTDPQIAPNTLVDKLSQLMPGQRQTAPRAWRQLYRTAHRVMREVSGLPPSYLGVMQQARRRRLMVHHFLFDRGQARAWLIGAQVPLMRAADEWRGELPASAHEWETQAVSVH